MVGVTSQAISEPHSFTAYFMGQLAGVIVAGVTNDLFFGKTQILTVVISNFVQILWNFWDIVYPHNNDELITWSLALFGIAAGFSDTFITILLPMTLADENRFLAYELTMLGTILGLFFMITYFTTSVTASLILSVGAKDIGNAAERVIIIAFLILSTIVLWSRAMI